MSLNKLKIIQPDADASASACCPPSDKDKPASGPT
jgi:hypothetical protein